MKDEEPKIEQPSINMQQLYLSLVSNDADEVEVLRTNKKYKIHWLKNGQLERLTKLLIGTRRRSDENKGVGSNGKAVTYGKDGVVLPTQQTGQSTARQTEQGATQQNERQEDVYDAILEDCKLACKAAAIIILDGYWKLKFWYWLLWRWFYYVKQYDNIQLLPILETGKKKVPLQQFYFITMSLTEAKDTLMRMRTEEAEAILREQSTAARSQTESKGSGS